MVDDAVQSRATYLDVHTDVVHPELNFSIVFMINMKGSSGPEFFFSGIYIFPAQQIAYHIPKSWGKASLSSESGMD